MDELLEDETLQQLIRLLQAKDTDVQLEATWALANVACKGYAAASALVRLEAVPALVQLLAGANDLCEQAVWALGNIAAAELHSKDLTFGEDDLADDITIPLDFRSVAIADGSAPATASAATLRPVRALSNRILSEAGPLQRVLGRATPMPLRLARIAAWAMCNLCLQHRMRDDCELLPLASALLFTVDADVDICVQQCVMWTLMQLPCDEEIASAPGVCARLISLLLKPDLIVAEPDLRMTALVVLGKLCAGSPAATRAAVEAGAPAVLLQLLLDPTCDEISLRFCCCTLSNIISTDIHSARAVIQSGVMPFLVRLATDKSRVKVAEEAVWPVANAFICTYPEDVPYVVPSSS
eukprot:TRINITY_DN1714_c0_g1_i16.p1 TRINITY_DN1714_c0_g1~~TRINITY_DN1714_c0_g1_i16.p1  ORF type:complete len:379 (-),score=65.81 TRINITY_DN1714_c0_g1_i16:474-1535(-)